MTVLKDAEEGVEVGSAEPGSAPAAITARVEKPDAEAIAAEAKKGYGFLVIGREPASEGDTFDEQITRSATEFGGPFAIAIARGADRQESVSPRLNILVPVTGTPVSRHGAEFAIALAQASRGSVTALHVAEGPRAPRSWQQQVGASLAPISSADAIIREIVRLGDPYGVDVKGAVRSRDTTQEAIVRQLKSGNHNLLVMGVSPRPGAQLSFGPVPATLLGQAECSILFVVSELPNSVPEPPAAPTRSKRTAKAAKR
jgi:nucleotide-binding universal stress UspA family protein